MCDCLHLAVVFLGVAGSQWKAGITAAHLALWAVLAFGVSCEQPALNN